MESLKVQLQQDIKDLIAQITYEREYMKPTKITIGERLTVETDTESKESKNYSEYRKLIHSLFDLFDTYFRLDMYSSKDFIQEFTNYLENEIKIVHTLMQDSLERRYVEQYRCLNSVYVVLIDKLSRFQIKLNVISITADDLK